MRLKGREVKAFLEALEAAERYKPFQVAKRNVLRRYGLQGTRLDRLLTALLYKMYRIQGILDRIAEEAAGVHVSKLPAFLRQATRLAAFLALYDEAGDEELAEQLVDAMARLAATRFGEANGERLKLLYKRLRRGSWRPSSELELEMRLLLPRLLVERLRKLLGGMEEVERFAEAVNNPRPTYGLRVNTLKATVDEVLDELAKLGVHAEPSHRVPNHVRYRPGLPYDKLSLLREGKVVPQDEASAAVGYILSPAAGERVADLCAAPGGKTTHIAELQRNTGQVAALEIYPDRMGRLVDLAQRTGTLASIVPVLGDAIRASRLLRPVMDKVLLDPPCSSTGAIARHPEARWRLTEATLAKLARRQHQMLTEAIRITKPGGRILYTVCSVMPEEGEHVIQRALEEQKVRLVPLQGPYSPSPLLPGTMRAWPHRHGTTGFFYALLEKVS